MSCAESSTAIPSARASRASTETIPCSLEMSRLASGSSSSSSLGRLIRACAIMTRCCSPPDSSPTRASAYRCAPTAVSMSATSSRRARDGSRMPNLCPSIPSETTSLTRSGMSGSMASFCGTYPIEASRGRPRRAVDEHRAPGDRLQAEDDPEQGGLARPVRPDETGELAGADGERDVPEDLPAAQPHADPVQPEQLCCHHGPVITGARSRPCLATAFCRSWTSASIHDW